MNKNVEVLYDEYIESYDPRVMLSKLKKSEFIELLMYAQDEVGRMDSIALLEQENQELNERLEYIHKVNKAVLDNFGQETFNYCIRGRK